MGCFENATNCSFILAKELLSLKRLKSRLIKFLLSHQVLKTKSLSCLPRNSVFLIIFLLKCFLQMFYNKINSIYWHLKILHGILQPTGPVILSIIYARYSSSSLNFYFPVTTSSQVNSSIMISNHVYKQLFFNHIFDSLLRRYTKLISTEMSK